MEVHGLQDGLSLVGVGKALEPLPLSMHQLRRYMPGSNRAPQRTQLRPAN